MNKKTIIIILILIGAALFYGGWKLGQAKSASSSPASFGSSGFGAFANNSRRGIGSGNGGAASGEVISKDSNSFTIKLRSGGSELILLSSSTPILKSSRGTLDDLQVGSTVTVQGQTGQAGTFNADLVQIRPASSTQPY